MKLLPQRKKVALLIETSNRFSRELVHGIRDWTKKNSPWAIHFSEQGRGEQPPLWLESWQGDGIIARIENTMIAEAVRKSGVPVINVSASEITTEFPVVVSDSYLIAKQAANHLIERGLKSFAYCGDAQFAWSKRHGDNFKKVLAEFGLTCEFFPTEASDVGNRFLEQEKLAAWLQNLSIPVGIFACYDIRGQQILDVCRASGLKVPNDYAVIGQHNDELLCELCDPPLSSVIPNARIVGYEAAECLHRLMNQESLQSNHLQIPPKGCSIRQSTDTVAVDDECLVTAMHYIQTHAHEAISVDSIAEVSGISRSILERKFRKTYGRSPWDQVLQIRLRTAEQLLTQSQLSIADIARRSGFGNPEYFSAAFKKLTGKSPRAMRKKA